MYVVVSALLCAAAGGYLAAAAFSPLNTLGIVGLVLGALSMFWGASIIWRRRPNAAGLPGGSMVLAVAVLCAVAGGFLEVATSDSLGMLGGSTVVLGALLVLSLCRHASKYWRRNRKGREQPSPQAQEVTTFRE